MPGEPLNASFTRAFASEGIRKRFHGGRALLGIKQWRNKAVRLSGGE